MSPARHARRAAIALAVLTATSACVDEQAHDGPDNSGGVSQPRSLGEPKEERFAVSPEPLWRSGQESQVRTLDIPGGARFEQNSLVLQGSGEMRLAAVDPATGKQRWSEATIERRIDASAPTAGLAPVVGDGNAWGVLLHYQDLSAAGPHGRDGIALVAGEDGRPRWRSLLPKRLARGDLSDPELKAADAKVAVSTIGDEDPTVWAVDVSDGSTMWDAKGVWPQFVAGGMVLGSTSPRSPAESNDDEDKPHVIALDADTGRKRWDLKDAYEWSKVILTAGDVALVVAKAASGPSGYEAIAIDARTGKTLMSLGDTGSNGRDCASDGHAIVCEVYDNSQGSVGGRLVSVDVTSRERHTSPIHTDASALFTARIDGAWDDYIFVSNGFDTKEYRAVDHDGRVVSRKLPGRLVGISENYAVFADLVDYPGTAYAVYRITQAE